MVGAILTTFAEDAVPNVHQRATADCPACGSGEAETVAAQPEDFEYRVVTDRPYGVLACRSCGSEFLFPRPSDAVLGSFYPPDYHAYNEDHGSLAAAFNITRSVKEPMASMVSLIMKTAVRSAVATALVGIVFGSAAAATTHYVHARLSIDKGRNIEILAERIRSASPESQNYPHRDLEIIGKELPWLIRPVCSGADQR